MEIRVYYRVHSNMCDINLKIHVFTIFEVLVFYYNLFDIFEGYIHKLLFSISNNKIFTQKLELVIERIGPA